MSGLDCNERKVHRKYVVIVLIRCVGGGTPGGSGQLPSGSGPRGCCGAAPTALRGAGLRPVAAGDAVWAREGPRPLRPL